MHLKGFLRGFRYGFYGWLIVRFNVLLLLLLCLLYILKVFEAFSLRPGSTVHCIYVFSLPLNPGQKSGQKTGLATYSKKNKGYQKTYQKVKLNN